MTIEELQDLKSDIQEMRTEPCEWCRDLGKYRGFEPVMFYEQTKADEEYQVLIAVAYCPNCGRKLEEDESE